jgi:PAS domain S-box-containing protein
MEKFFPNRNWYTPIIFCTLLFFGVWVISFNNYLLYHVLAEMFGIVVSAAIFIIAWNTRSNLDNDAFLIIGIAYLFIGGIDLLHTLAYKGMSIFVPDQTNLPTQLWIASRYLQSITFLIAPFFIYRKTHKKMVFLGYLGLTILLIMCIFYWKIFPVCFVEGTGLTPFKKISELLICLILLLSMLKFYRERKAFDKTVFNFIMASLCLSIISGMSFTLYSHPYSFTNFFGHYIKVIYFYMVYKAIIETGLTRPYDVLFRNLKKSETALVESEARYRSMMEASQDPVYICSPDFVVSYMNPAMISRIGHDATGEPCYEAVNRLDIKCNFCVFDEIKKKETILKETFRQKDGRYYHVTHSPIHHVDGSLSKLAVFRDVTDLKEIELDLRVERDKARLYLDIVGNIVVVLNPDTTIAQINKRGCELLESEEEDILGKKWFHTFVPEKERRDSFSAFNAVMSGSIQHYEYFEYSILSLKGHEKLISWHNTLLTDETGKISGTLSSGEDISEARRLQNELLWELSASSALSELYVPLISPEISINEIGKKILEKGKGITNSEHGYVSTIEPVDGTVYSHTLTEMMADCNLDGANKTISFPRGDNGLYGGLWGHSLNTKKPFFTNSPEKHPSFKGLPKGHIPIRNFLSIPVLFEERLVGQISLSNKKGDYEEKDVEAIYRLAQYYALAIHRWQTADKLRRAKDELEQRVQERTEALSETNLMLINEIEERKVLEDNLIKSERELQNLSGKLIQSYEEERRRIGEELHDGIAQTLSAIKVWSDAAISQMEKNKAEESLKSVKSILSLAKASVEEVRNIIKNLRPAILDDLGLKAAVSWLCQEFEKTHPEITLEKNVNLTDEQIPENLNIVIFRIIQESLNNISKHSRASRASILLNQAAEKMELKIYDNGDGFDIDEVSERTELTEKGIGLTTMEERARLSGGVFSIVSSPVRGTIIRVVWRV